MAFGGGVDGASIWVFISPARTGVGELARYTSRFASSSPVLPSRAAPAAVKPLCRRRAERATSGGGVRGALGGDDRKAECDLLSAKEVMGKSSSSSSDSKGEWGSGTVDVSETKDRLGTWGRPKRACLRWYTGDDSGSWKLFFHEDAVVVDVLTFTRAWLLDAGCVLVRSKRGRLLSLCVLPGRLADRRMSSENMGAWSGDESRTLG